MAGKKTTFKMDTDDFIDIWVAALSLKDGNQWAFLLRRCWDEFSTLESNVAYLNTTYKGWDKLDASGAASLIDKKVYSKITNLRATMKAKTEAGKAPPIPKGRTKSSGSKAVDWEAHAQKFKGLLEK